jgi:hypothetical protein
LWSTSARSCALSLLATASSLSRAAIRTIALLVVLPVQLPGGCRRLLPRADDACDAAALICEADSPKPLYPDTTLLQTCRAEAAQQQERRMCISLMVSSCKVIYSTRHADCSHSRLHVVQANWRTLARAALRAARIASSHALAVTVCTSKVQDSSYSHSA